MTLNEAMENGPKLLEKAVRRSLDLLSLGKDI